MDLNNKEAAKEAAKKTRDKTDSKRKTAELLKSIFLGSMYALWGYFLGGSVLPYGAMPFGVAFLAASDRRVFYIYAGLVVSALSGDGNKILLISVYSAILLLRLSVRLVIDPPWKRGEGQAAGERTVREIYPYIFSEHLSMRMASAAVGAFAIGLYRLISGGMLYYDLYGTVISTVSAPLAVLLFSGFFVTDAKKYRRLVGFLALSAAVIFSASDTRLWGISLSVFGCMLATLYITKTQGAVIGILSGALLGLAVSVELAPAFAFAGLVSGILFSISPALAAGSALSVALAWGIYVRGLGVLNGPAAAIVSSALVFIVWDKLFLSDRANASDTDVCESDNREKTPCDLNAERLRDTEVRLTGARNSFEEMSETLMDISQRIQTPSAADIRQICDNAFDSCCVSCERKPLCWGERYKETSAALGELCDTLRKKGSVSPDGADETLVRDCPRLPDILSEINHNAYLHTRQLLEGDRTELFALDYAAAASFISEALYRKEGAYEPDGALWSMIENALVDGNIPFLGGSVFGSERKRIVLLGVDRQALTRDADDIKKLLSEVCPFKISEPELDENDAILRFSQLDELSVTYAIRNLRAEGEDKYCGDTSGVFSGADGRFYSFISDGMGSGRDAALTSGLCGLFLKKFLEGGNSCEGTLRLLNGFLRNRGDGSLHECSATVDLLELDLLSGSALFYKSGAAPTYVFRNGGLFKLRSQTVPVGIIKELDFRKIELAVGAGDLVVMVSDGVTDGKEECPWLFDLLRSQGETSAPERLAELIVKYAKAEGAADDVSVTVIRIGENK